MSLTTRERVRPRPRSARSRPAGSYSGRTHRTQGHPATPRYFPHRRPTQPAVGRARSKCWRTKGWSLTLDSMAEPGDLLSASEVAAFKYARSPFLNEKSRSIRGSHHACNGANISGAMAGSCGATSWTQQSVLSAGTSSGRRQERIRTGWCATIAAHMSDLSARTKKGSVGIAGSRRGTCLPTTTHLSVSCRRTPA